MKDEQILKKAIKKAIKNGWKDFDGEGSYLDKDISGVIVGMWHINKIIFSHSFAKAYFGMEELYQGKTADETYEEYSGNYRDREEFEGDWICEFYPEEAWVYHLKQLAVCENRLRYLERFLKCV